MIQLFNKKYLVTLALLIIIIQAILSYNLYFSSNHDSKGNVLDCFGTIKNIFGILPFKEMTNTLKELSNDIVNYSDELPDELKDETIKLPKIESETTFVTEENIEKIPELINKKKNPSRKKEVFNIDNNAFTYKQAEYVCKAYNAKLATYQQLVKAHENGANWCNYGWSANNQALYPIQSSFYNLMKLDSKDKNSCGKPGINGGYFPDENLKFGVNCYGFRPKPDDSKIIYSNKSNIANETNDITSFRKSQNNFLKDLNKKIEDGKIEIRPFNNSKWSRFSKRMSKYILTPKFDYNKIKNSTKLDEEKTIDEEKTTDEESDDYDNVKTTHNSKNVL